MKTPTQTSQSDTLADLVKELIATEPHSADGYKWASRPQAFYCAKLNISVETLRRRIKHPPFVRAVKVVDGRTVCLLRLGNSALKGISEVARIMRGIWRNKTGFKTTDHQRKCLWGFAGDVMSLEEVIAFTNDPGKFALDCFTHSLDNWHQTVVGIKLEAESTPGFKPRYLIYPSIPTIRKFWRASIYSYIMTLQSSGKLSGTNSLALPLMHVTDPLNTHPGDDSTEEEMIVANAKVWEVHEKWYALKHGQKK